MDLGALLGGGQPQMAAQPDPGLKSEWDGWMQNPANKAALLSFGLNLMNGSWGGPAQAFSQAAGAGVEAAVGTQEAIDAEANRQAAIGRDESNRKADRELRRELNREDNAAAMERAKVGAGASREQARLDRLTLAYDRQEAAELAKIEALQAKAAEAKSLGLEDPAIYEAQLATRQKRLEAIQAKRDALLGVGVGEGDAIAGPETSVNPAAGAAPLGMPGGVETAGETSITKGAPSSESPGMRETIPPPPEFMAAYNTWPKEKQDAFIMLPADDQIKVFEAYKAAGRKPVVGTSGRSARAGEVPPKGSVNDWLSRALTGAE